MSKSWLSAAAAAAIGLYLLNGTVPAPVGDGQVRPRGHVVLFYRDPMHPSYTSNRPGKAPDCGMDLQPVFADDMVASQPAGDARPGNAIRLDRRQRETLGVAVSAVERASFTRDIRTIGRVEIEEDRLFTLRAGGGGTVTRIAAGTESGNHVRKGQPLLVAYGRDFTAAQRTFLYALRAADSPPPVVAGQPADPGALSLGEATRDLQSLGFDDSQIRRLSTSRQVAVDVTLTSPADGIVIARNVSRGQNFEHQAELFRIADLTQVWISADVSGGDEAQIPPGTSARIVIPGRADGLLHGSVADTLPRYDTAARTARLRLSVPNARLLLRPDMVVDVVFEIKTEATTVPADAVVDNDGMHIAFVEVSDGVFEPRTIETGWRSGDRVQVRRGVVSGESVVVKGAFPLLSEHRLRGTSAGAHD
jgi:membrane fusion protein, copper/silver efflux system